MKKKLDCVDKFISCLFEKLGRCIARNPLPFLLVPLVIVAVLCAGLSQLEIDDNVEHLFTPSNSPGRVDLKKTQEIFMTGNEGEEFLPNRELDLFLGRGRLILSRPDGGNILEPEYMADVYNLDKLVRSTPVPGNGSTFDDDLCMRWLNLCVPNPLIVFYENHQNNFGLVNITYPIGEIELPLDLDLMNLPPGKVIGGMDQWPDMKGQMPPNVPQGDVASDPGMSDEDLLALMRQKGYGESGDLSQLGVPPNAGLAEAKNQSDLFAPDPDQLSAYNQASGSQAGNFPSGFPETLPEGFNPADFQGSNENPIPPFLGPITQTLFLGPNLGNVEYYPDTEILKSATHVYLIYTVDSGPEYIALSRRWEDQVFMVVTEDYMNKTDLLKIDRVVSTSLASEVNEATHKIIPRFATTFSMIIVFAVFSCIMRDWVLSKPWLGFLGVISAAISIISAIGLLSFMGMKYNEVVSLMPFLIIGVGVDNMFIMIAAWRQHSLYDSVETRMAATFAEAAVSITITNITDILAFVIGAVSVLPGVSMFCTYAGVAMVFVYFYQITFFGACMAYIGRREFQNRHCLLGKVVRSREESQHNKLYRIFCAGGRSLRNKSVNKKIDLEHRVMKFFRQYYGPFLMKPSVKACVILGYFVYVTGALIGCTRIQEGIRFKNLAMDNSPAWKFYDLEDTHFRRYGPPVSVIFLDEIPYWEENIQVEIEDLTQTFEDGEYSWGSDLTVSWLREFTTHLKGVYGTSNVGKETFLSELRYKFLKDPRNSKYELDIQFENDTIDSDNVTHWSIQSSRFLVTTKDVDTALRERSMMLQFRKKASDSHFHMLTFHPSFKVFDQYVGVIANTVQTLGIAMICMFFISCVMIPHPVCAIWVTLCVISIDMAVIGYMSMWGVTLDAISMVNIILCIGFSVDFSAHITYAFVIAKDQDSNKRAISALHSLGMPILQGALSSIIAISVLSTAPVYIFRTFFKTLFLVMVFGAAHGLILLPVCLSFLGKCMPQVIETEKHKKQGVEDAEAQLDETDPKSVPLIYGYHIEDLEKVILENYLHARETDV